MVSGSEGRFSRNFFIATNCPFFYSDEWVQLSCFRDPKAHNPARRDASFSTGFIRFFDMVGCRVRLIYKPNAFFDTF